MMICNPQAMLWSSRTMEWAKKGTQDMHLTKKAVVADINKSKSVEAIRLSTDELPAERNKKIRELKSSIEKKMRQKKNITIVIVE